MSLSPNDIVMTDAELDAIAFRDLMAADDAVLTALAALARCADEGTLIDAGALAKRAPADASSTTARRGGLALTATVALMLSSTGMAAAIGGDPLAPLHYLAHEVARIAPQGAAQDPGWDLGGSAPVVRVQVAMDGRQSKSVERAKPAPGDLVVARHPGHSASLVGRHPQEGVPVRRGSNGGGSAGGGTTGRGKPPKLPVHKPGRTSGSGIAPGLPATPPPVGIRHGREPNRRTTTPGEGGRAPGEGRRSQQVVVQPPKASHITAELGHESHAGESSAVAASVGTPGSARLGTAGSASVAGSDETAALPTAVS
jgi:hypothetical protein